MRLSTIAATALAGTAYAAEHMVAVGTKAGDLVFKPDSITAAEGDLVHFKFWPKNHSVAQASFNRPCAPMDDGFWSGFVPTMDANAVANWTFTYEVTNASQPIWFYCSQGQHCQAGMVGVINPPQSGPRTLEAWKEASANVQSNISPTSVAGTGGNLTQNATVGTGTGTGTGTGNSSSPNPSTGAASHLSGSAAFAGLTGLFTFFLL